MLLLALDHVKTCLGQLLWDFLAKLPLATAGIEPTVGSTEKSYPRSKDKAGAD
jgi:hypothetical protein